MLMRQFTSPAALAEAGFRPGNDAGNAARAKYLFSQRPKRAEFQAVAADVDGDGDEDKTAIRLLPLTGVSGQSLATTVSVDLELKPLKLFKGLNFAVGRALAEALIITNFMVGQDDMLVSRGAIGLEGLVGEAADNLLDMPWAGPGLSIYLTLKNVSTGTIVLYGGIRGIAIVG